MNAIREARLTYGRVDDPFSDDDATRTEEIYQLLHVQEKVDATYEHFPLVNKEKPHIDASVLSVANLLEQLPPNEASADQQPQAGAVEVSLPKAAHAKK